MHLTRAESPLHAEITRAGGEAIPNSQGSHGPGGCHDAAARFLDEHPEPDLT
jgi:hypothetical protein